MYSPNMFKYAQLCTQFPHQAHMSNATAADTAVFSTMYLLRKEVSFSMCSLTTLVLTKDTAYNYVFPKLHT